MTHVNDDKGYFCMDWLGEGWENWKAQMLQGQCHPETARQAGKLMGSIHRLSEGDGALRESFATDSNFEELRLDPYLRATAGKHPQLKDLIDAEVQRIKETRDGLVHGDFSPKNILVKGDSLMLLDCEVAWYGDTSFDLAFLLNHLMLKGCFMRRTASRSEGSIRRRSVPTSVTGSCRVTSSLPGGIRWLAFSSCSC